jgi:hypothetical protein
MIRKEIYREKLNTNFMSDTFSFPVSLTIFEIILSDLTRQNCYPVRTFPNLCCVTAY